MCVCVCACVYACACARVCMRVRMCDGGNGKKTDLFGLDIGMIIGLSTPAPTTEI